MDRLYDENSEFNNLNHLFLMALKYVASMPFGIVVEKWRWEVFSGLPMDAWNRKWWYLREQYEGISHPFNGINNNISFDAGALYEIPADLQYIRLSNKLCSLKYKSSKFTWY